MTAPQQSSVLQQWIAKQLRDYSLVDALKGRRSRRFGLGMEIDSGPFAYKSEHPPIALTEEEEAALAFAACGITGYALADLAYGRGEGGNMLVDLFGRTAASADSINAVSVIVINDDGTYLLKRPQDYTYDEIPDVIALSQEEDLVGLYRQMRVKIADQRTTIPVKPGYNFNINKWSVYAKGGTYFLPINEMSAIYINALLESFEPEMGLFVNDERNNFLPPGIGRYAKSRGGHLWDDPRDNRVVTVQGLEMSLAEAISVEQGMILQNIGLMCQALGIGGFANYARNEFGWFQALGFRMQEMWGSRYVGANWFLQSLLKLMGRDFKFPYAVGLERNGETLLETYAPPYYPDMAAAVRAFVDYKYGAGGTYREGTEKSAWKQPQAVADEVKPPSEVAIQATIDYCDYIFDRYGRFPAYSAPFRSVIGYQATHVDVDFYDQFFRADSLTPTQRERYDFHANGSDNA